MARPGRAHRHGCAAAGPRGTRRGMRALRRRTVPLRGPSRRSVGEARRRTDRHRQSRPAVRHLPPAPPQQLASPHAGARRNLGHGPRPPPHRPSQTRQTNRIGEKTDPISEQRRPIREQANRIGEQTDPIGEQRRRIDEQRERVGDETDRVDEQPARVGDETDRVDEQPARVGKQRERFDRTEPRVRLSNGCARDDGESRRPVRSSRRSAVERPTPRQRTPERGQVPGRASTSGAPDASPDASPTRAAPRPVARSRGAACSDSLPDLF